MSGRARNTPRPRSLAARILRDVERRDGFSNRILSEHLEANPGLDARDRGLVTTLVYGVLRHRSRLDHHIAQVARNPTGLKGLVRQLLRVATFELRELDRPARVAISEAQAVARELEGGKLGPVVQAVLAGVDREGAAVDAASEGARPLDAMELRWSIPRWLAGRWIKQLGPEQALARAKAVLEVPTVDLRVDVGRMEPARAAERLREDHPGISIETVEGQPQALRTRGGGDLFYGPLHDGGLISVQALGSQQAAQLLAPRPGERVLDACAGLGTKTLQLAELMGRRGTLVAADADAKRLEGQDDLRRRGALEDSELQLQVVAGDLTAALAGVDDGGPYDAVLLDAPCTGLGNLARHPEIRWRAQFADVGERATLQRTLLERCLDRVKPGGRLVYAVCSLEPEEGPDIVKTVSPGRAKVVRAQTWTPEAHHADGFYCALLEPTDPGPTAGSA